MYRRQSLILLAWTGAILIVTAIIFGFAINSLSMVRAIDLYVYDLLFPPLQSLVPILKVITSLAGFYGILALSAIAFVLLVETRHLREAFAWLVTIGIAQLFVHQTKYLFVIIRPDNALVDTIGYSYPSGHTTMIAVFATLMILYAIKHVRPMSKMRVISVLCLLIVIAVSFSRLSLGAHWFSDIVGGLLLATGVTFFVYSLLRIFWTSNNRL